MFITDKEVERIVSNSRNRFISKQYYQQDCVNEIYITYDEKTKIHKIQGALNTRGQDTYCIIEVDQTSKIIDYRCNCYWCDEYSACGHIGAVLYKVQELSPDTFPFHYKNDREAKRQEEMRAWKQKREEQEDKLRKLLLERKQEATKEFINSYKQEMNQEFQSLAPMTKYQVQATLDYDYGDTIKFKIGNSKKYIIKDLRKFLLAIKNEEVVSYGKNLTFKHSLSMFDESSLKQIDLMKEILASYHDEQISNKSIALQENNIDDIYDLYHQLPHLYATFSTKDIFYKPVIKITYKKEYYQITLEDVKEFLLGNRHMYSIEGSCIKRVSLDKQGKVVSLLRQLYLEEECIVHDEDALDFYKYILAPCKENIEIQGEDLSKEYRHEDKIILYGDIDDQGRIYLQLECHYPGDVIKQGFDDTLEDTSVTLDKVISYIEKYIESKDTKKHLVYLDANSDSTYQFIQNGLPILAKYCEIYVSEGLQRLGTKTKFSMQVGVSIKNDLLALDIDSIDIPKEELTTVLQAYKRKKKFHKLKDGRLLYLESDELEKLDTMLHQYHVDARDMVDGHIDMQLYRAFSLENDAIDSEYLTFTRSETFKEMINRFSTNVKKTYAIPKNYTNILREYQKDGYQWLQTISECGFGGILADDMGLGKTLQVIAMLDANKNKDSISIVVCPSSLILNWQDEIHKFSKELNCCSIYGSLKQRKQDIKNYQEYDVFITSYDYLRRDIELYKDINFAYIVLDEAQYIKNQKTKNAISVKQLQGKHRFALTGTPIENSLAELWSIFDFLMKGYLYNYHYFLANYENLIVKENDEEAKETLKKLITPFILRRTKKEVLTELPEKIENTITISFKEEERKLYLANLMQVNTSLQEQLQVDKVDHIEILAMLTRLRQLCCEPRVVFDNIHHPSSKMEGCLELIRNLKENNQKVLLFSSFTSVLDLISKELSKEKISHYVLTGSTDKEKRRELVKKFQEDDTTVFLISLKAGGTGLNLTAAQAVIHYDPWWNMSAQSQATDRAHRIGQVNTVQVFKLIMQDSVEEKIAQLQEKKKNLADTFVEGNQGSIGSMSNEDLMDLFSI